MKPTGVHYGRTASGAYALAGEVEVRVINDNVVRDLSYGVSILVNGNPMAGGGGGCTGTDRIISVAWGIPVTMTPPTFFCTDFCLRCTWNFITGQPSGNWCNPPQGPSPSGLCFCHDNCFPLRIVPGHGWQIEVPQLSPADEVTVLVTPHAAGLPEFDTSDDAVAVRVADVTLCEAIHADLGRQGGLPGADGHFDNNDFIVFIGYFFDADPMADLGKQGGLFGPDGLYDNNDFVVFIDLFFAGPC